MDPTTLLVTEIATETIAKVLKYVYKQMEQQSLTDGRPTQGDQKLSHPPVIGKFITCNEGFREELVSLKTAIDQYSQREQPGRSFNVFLGAAPGSGKSYLVKQMATELGEKTVSYFEYQVAAFRSVDDLFDVFRVVQSENLKGKLPFVLLDEVDSKVDDHYLLPNLLAPLWDGKYHVGSTTYYLGRAVFFFAASSIIPSPTIETIVSDGRRRLSYSDFATSWSKRVTEYINSSKVEKVDKLRDFLDRMDAILCIPPISTVLKDSNPAKEYWLLSCALITKHFNNVTRVEKSAAWALISLLIKGGSIRRADSAVFRSSPSKDNTFRFTNLPENVQRRTIQDNTTPSLHDSYFDLA